MVLAAFQRMLNNPAKMAFFNQDPILKATFMACYEYKKAGHAFKDLGWFCTPSTQALPMKKAA